MPAKKKELPAAAPDLDLEEFRRKIIDFRSYKEVRKHLEQVMHFHLKGSLDSKILNGQVYIASALIIVMDRERQYEGVGQEDLQSVIAECAGEVNLTNAQMARIMQQPTTAMRIKILKESIAENANIVEGELVTPEIEVGEVIAETEKRETWQRQSAF